MTLNERAKLERMMGPSGCTLVRPIRAKTTMYSAPPMDTDAQVSHRGVLEWNFTYLQAFAIRNDRRKAQ